MAYWDLSLLAYDADFFQRTTASAAEQGYPEPSTWADDHKWQVAAAPTFSDKYASALAGGVPNPGRDQSVISDDELRAAVQAANA